MDQSSDGVIHILGAAAPSHAVIAASDASFGFVYCQTTQCWTLPLSAGVILPHFVLSWFDSRISGHLSPLRKVLYI